MTTRGRDRRAIRNATWALLAGLCVLVPGSTALAAQARPQLATNPPTPSARAFLRIELPKHAAYVGESLPITVRAYYRDDTAVTVAGAPALANAEFTLKQSDPAQSRADMGGATYLVVTWKGHLSPVKAGHYDLSMSLPSTLKWQSIVQRPNAGPGAPGDALPGDPFAGLFDDPSMGSGRDIMQEMQRRMQQMMRQAESNFDVGAVQEKDVVLKSSDATLDVAPLPAQGRPATFTGAIGRFEVSASANPTWLRAGEPTTLELRVRGQGSFDRVDSPGVPESSEWKTYPPSAKQTDDATKVFTQALVPDHAGVAAIPRVAFSYFDPDAARYVTVQTEPIAVDVSPGASIVAGSGGSAPSVPSGPTLAPDAEAVGAPVGTLAPVFERRGFWIAQAVPLLGLGGALAGIGLRRRLSADLDRPLRRRAGRALRGYRTAMDRAVDGRDAVAFFAAARAAFQQRLGARWRVKPEAITLAEIEGRLEAGDAQAVRQVFDFDAARFSGFRPEPTDLPRWRQIVNEQLDHLEEA